MVTRTRVVWLFLIFIAAALWLAVQRGLLVVPDRWNPWAPLVIADEPNFLTSWKLARASGDDALCRNVLNQTSDLAFVELPDRVTGQNCGFSNAVRIERTSVDVGEPFALSCRATLSLALWERHVLQPEAERTFDSRVTRIEHFGSYACRNLYGRADGARSRHATADAFDVAGFRLADGRRIRVVGDWDETMASRSPARQPPVVADEPTGEARFLKAVHRGACRYFDAVLGPDYNAAHADHFHFDRGGFRTCR
jgi:hypothetical protein